ncbi:MAG TPA: class I SAM-dependent methyltransferase [Steroidobacteraceae bacterium]
MIPAACLNVARRAYVWSAPFRTAPLTLAQALVQTPALLLTRMSRKHRRLEIGPGRERIEGFETLNVVGGINVDYVWNAAARLPFRKNTFEIIYASHVLEHIPWYKTERVLADWVRTLVPGGRLELWVPDGLKICRAFVEAETNGTREFHRDGWWRFNPDRDPCVWASGRIFSYGDGTGRRNHPNWHLALFSFRHLEQLLKRAGCSRVERLDRSRVRGHDHGWINLGVCGIKGGNTAAGRA